MGYRTVDPTKFQQGLEVAGPQAVEDFARAMQRWTSQGKMPAAWTGDSPQPQDRQADPWLGRVRSVTTPLMPALGKQLVW